jgi:hypothetical protein
MKRLGHRFSAGVFRPASGDPHPRALDRPIASHPSLGRCRHEPVAGQLNPMGHLCPIGLGKVGGRPAASPHKCALRLLGHHQHDILALPACVSYGFTIKACDSSRMHRQSPIR